MMRAIREMLFEDGFVEVETPLLVHSVEGAGCDAFSTKCHALDGQQMLLRVSPELALKRLVIGGMERVFEIGRSFRNEDAGRLHSPEFTSIELYKAYACLEDAVELLQRMIVEANIAVSGDAKLTVGGRERDLRDEFRRIDVLDTLVKATGLSVEKLHCKEEVLWMLRSKGIVHDAGGSLDALLERLVAVFVEPQCEGPTLLVGHPVVCSPLAKKLDAHRSDRFELFFDKIELANAYQEQDCPAEQAKVFKDRDFVRALEYGMPPTVGIGVGLDRLAMLLLNQTAIRDVIPFPLIKSETARDQMAGIFGSK